MKNVRFLAMVLLASAVLAGVIGYYTIRFVVALAQEFLQ